MTFVDSLSWLHCYLFQPHRGQWRSTAVSLRSRSPQDQQTQHPKSHCFNLPRNVPMCVQSAAQLTFEVTISIDIGESSMKASPVLSQRQPTKQSNCHQAQWFVVALSVSLLVHLRPRCLITCGSMMANLVLSNVRSVTWCSRVSII